MERFIFLRAFVKNGGRQFPQFVKINGKAYGFCSAERIGNNIVYTYGFDNLEHISFELTQQEKEIIAALGIKYERMIMAKLKEVEND